jgi:hypothetical protein
MKGTKPYMIDATPLEMHKIAHYLFYLDGIVDLLNAFIAYVGHGKMKEERFKEEPITLLNDSDPAVKD